MRESSTNVWQLVAQQLVTTRMHFAWVQEALARSFDIYQYIYLQYIAGLLNVDSAFCAIQSRLADVCTVTRTDGLY